ncbi:putative F-box-like domain superfamily protein [Helianthus debilis subsp. tardiflorus]
MEDRGPPMDMISNLPSNIIQTMLTLMPMRDAFRTSILSRSWKNHCADLPKLKFDDELFHGSAHQTLSIKCILLHIIYPILLLHQGPILEFSLCISHLYSCCEIDRIILHLSRKATVEEFTLCVGIGNEHKLLPSFFRLHQLTVLKLHNCVFQPSAMFKGFSWLIRLDFENVGINADVLLRLISNCPLLMDFTLIGDEKHLKGCWNSDYVELAEDLPHIEFLRMSSYPIQCFATSLAPQKLPALLVRLKYLHL